MLKKVLKIFLYLFVIFLLVLASIGGVIYLYKDKIIYLFIEDANKNLQTKVDVSKIEIDLFTTFPELSLHFKDVKVVESKAGSSKYVAIAEHLYFTISLQELLDNNIKIKNLIIRNAIFDFKVFKDGSNNFTVLKKSDSKIKKAIVFDLKGVVLDNVDISYSDFQYRNQYHALIKNAIASLRLEDDDWNISLNGNLVSNGINVQEYVFLKDKPIELQGELLFNSKTNIYTLKESTIKILNANFEAVGYYKHGKIPYIDLKVSEKTSDFQTLLSFLPNKVTKELELYKSRGRTYFNAIVKGDVSRSRKPLIVVDFGCQDASFYHPEYKEEIKNASFSGEFNNGGGAEKGFTSLKINNLKATINNKSLEANFYLRNFSDPFIELRAKSNFDLTYLARLFPQKKFKNISGEIDVDIFISAYVNEIKKNNFSNLTTEGNIDFRNVSFKSDKSHLPFENIYTSLRFDKENVDVGGFRVKIGNSDFNFEGKILNVFKYFLQEKGQLTLDGKLISRNIEVEELLLASTSTDKYYFSFTPNIFLKTNFEANTIHFKKFRPQHVSGNLNISPTGWEIDAFKMNLANGSFNLKGSIHQNKDSTFAAEIKGEITNMKMDTALFITDNFGQDFITHKSLKGKLGAKFEVFFNFDKNLEIDLNTILAETKLTINEGVLQNFEPMKGLSKFIREEALENVKFSQLQNELQISDRKILIPLMDIKTNIATLQIMGYHQFDGVYEYKVKVPIKNYKRKNQELENEAIETVNSTQIYLYLIIKGDLNGYKVYYDKATVKDKIKERWQQEKKEFKEIFKKDYLQKKIENEKPKEVNEDEYFDF